MTGDKAQENYALASEAITGHRAVIEDVVSTLRTAWESGDDPVLYLQGIAAAYGQQAAFATGGPGAAMFTITCFMLDETRRELEGALETIEILQDPQAMADLAEADGPGARTVSSAEMLQILECRRAEAPAIEAAPEPCCKGHHVQCTAVDLCCGACPENTDIEDYFADPSAIEAAIEAPREWWCGTHGIYRHDTCDPDAGEPLPIDAAPEPCCESHGLLCAVSDSGHDACCPRCPEWRA